MNLATGGSSAVPGAFEPQVIMDQYGNEQVIIDGGIVCNNPSLVALIMANVIRRKKHIRVISLGTGVGPLQPIDSDTFTRFDWTKLAVDVAVDFDTFMADRVVKHLLD